jgi:hypothetical protein
MGTSSCRLFLPSINYIYCADTILDKANPDTLELTRQSLERLATERGAPSQSPRKSEPPVPEARQNPNEKRPHQQKESGRRGGMDSEHVAMTG